MQISFLKGVIPTTRERAIGDILAGLTLAAVNIPQVLGYTRIAGTPVVTGLYTVLLPLIVFTIFCSSRHLVVAADSATAAILFGTLAHIATPASPHYMALISTAALLTGGFLVLARTFKLGFFADFLSRTVLIGFLAGVGVQVGIAMLGDMAGIAMHASRTMVQAWEFMQGLLQPDLVTLGLAAIVVSAILLSRRIAPRAPVALCAVLGSIWASTTFHFARHGIAVIGPVQGGLPSFTLPHVTWAETLTLLPVAFSCCLMVLAQSAATSRLFAERYDERVDEDADILGLAMANIAAAVTGTFVVNGSPTQTAMADRVGARSQIAQQTFAGVALLVLLFLAGQLQDLPRCVLAAIVFTIALSMIDLPALGDIRRESPGEFKLAILTAATVVVVGVEQGILLAMLLSLFRHVRHTYRPATMMLVGGTTGSWHSASATPGLETEPGLIVYRFGADLFYANHQRFVDDVRRLIKQAPSPIRWFIVDAGQITNIDYSAAQSIRNLLRDQKAQGICMIFARVTPDLRSDMDRHRISVILGEAQIFSTLHEAISKAKISRH